MLQRPYIQYFMLAKFCIIFQKKKKKSFIIRPGLKCRVINTISGNKIVNSKFLGTLTSTIILRYSAKYKSLGKYFIAVTLKSLTY